MWLDNQQVVQCDCFDSVFSSSGEPSLQPQLHQPLCLRGSGSGTTRTSGRRKPARGSAPDLCARRSRRPPARPWGGPIPPAITGQAAVARSPLALFRAGGGGVVFSRRFVVVVVWFFSLLILLNRNHVFSFVVGNCFFELGKSLSHTGVIPYSIYVFKNYLRYMLIHPLLIAFSFVTCG